MRNLKLVKTVPEEPKGTIFMSVSTMTSKLTIARVIKLTLKNHYVLEIFNCKSNSALGELKILIREDLTSNLTLWGF